MRNSERETYIIWTASDPIACSLGRYLEEKGFVVPAHSTLGESATVLVFLTNKRSLASAIKSFCNEKKVIGMDAKAIRIARVPNGERVV